MTCISLIDIVFNIKNKSSQSCTVEDKKPAKGVTYTPPGPDALKGYGAELELTVILQ